MLLKSTGLDASIVAIWTPAPRSPRSDEAQMVMGAINCTQPISYITQSTLLQRKPS